MSIDLAGPENVDRMAGFAAGCTATWVFVRNLVMKPAIKSCHQRCTDLEESVKWLKDQLKVKDDRIGDLETALFTSGIPSLRAAMQGVVSEARVATDRAVEKKP